MGRRGENSQKTQDVGRERRSETDEDGWFDDWFDLGSFEDEDGENSASGDPFAPNHQIEVVELSDVDDDWAEETSEKTDEESSSDWLSQWFGGEEEDDTPDSSPFDDSSSFLEDDPFPQTYRYHSVGEAANATITSFQRERGDVIDLSPVHEGLTFGGKTPRPFGIWFASDPGGSYVYADCDGDARTTEVYIWVAGLDQVIASDFGLEPGPPISILDYSQSSAPTHIDLRTPLFADFHHVIGAAAQENLLKGSDSADILQGGSQRDLFDGRLGRDVLKGGDGLDRASYWGRESPVTVRLVLGSAASVYVGDHVEDILHSIENIDGTEHGDVLTGDEGPNHFRGWGGADRLIGEGGADVLRGGAGSDTLDGGEENDWLVGGDGNDILSGHTGDDRLDGGAGEDQLSGGEGRDWAIYTDVRLPLSIDMSASFAVPVLSDGTHEDTLYSIENVRGGRADDTLIGDEHLNWLYGSTGDDVLEGRGGRDWLLGEVGDDRLFGGSGDDRLVGGFGRDTLRGEEGNDWLQGGEGFDDLDGGAGEDTAAYTKSLKPVIVILSQGSSSVAYVGSVVQDTLRNIENVAGSIHNDLLSGDSGRNVLSGHGGDDRLHGYGGDDVLYGDAGDDDLQGNGGDDSLCGGAGRDSLMGGEGADRFVYWSALETIGDTILDFDPSEGDRIRFYGIDADEQTTGRQTLAFSEHGAQPHAVWSQEHEESGVMLLGDTDGHTDTHEISIHVERLASLQSSDVFFG